MRASKFLHRILKFINYANLCKFIQNQWKMLHVLLSFLGRFWFCLFYLIGLGAGFKTSTHNFLIHSLCKFMQIYSKSMKNATSLSFLGRFWFCLFYLIGLGAGFKTSTHNFLIHSLCKFMQIYSKSMKNATSPLFRNHNRSALEAGTYIMHRVIYYLLVIFIMIITICFSFQPSPTPLSQMVVVRVHEHVSYYPFIILS